MSRRWRRGFARKLGKNKLFVLGHSWGSFLGLQLAQLHPEWLHAYIGVSQLIDGPENERRNWRFAMDAARRAGNAEAVRELEAIAPYAAPGQTIPIKDLYVQRKWVGFYGGVMAYRHDNSARALSSGSPPSIATKRFSVSGKATTSPHPICFLLFSSSTSPRSARSMYR